MPSFTAGEWVRVRSDVEAAPAELRGLVGQVVAPESGQTASTQYRVKFDNIGVRAVPEACLTVFANDPYA